MKNKHLKTLDEGRIGDYVKKLIGIDKSKDKVVRSELEALYKQIEKLDALTNRLENQTKDLEKRN